MISCNLTKPESTFDQIRKEYAKLKPVDAALIASAIAESGHFANVVHDGKSYVWPDDQEKLAKALVIDVIAAQNLATEGEPKVKKVAKSKLKAVEETIIRLTVPIVASQEAGEALLGKRKDLKAMLGEILGQGVEFLYTSADIRWRWSLERVNWTTVSGGELPHHVMFNAEFTDKCIGVELGPGGKKKKIKKR